MKLTNLFKKVATVLCALALVGMLAACSNGSSSSSDDDKKGSGSGSGSGTEAVGEYKVMYDGIEIFWEIKESRFNKIKNNLSSGSYTISGKTMTLNDKGFDELLEFMSEDSEYTYVAIIVYKKKCVTGMPAEFLTQFKAVLTEGTDYTVTHNGKVYELTDSGMAKSDASFGNNN